MERNVQRWSNFVLELSNLVFFWFFGILYFFIYRVIFIFFFHTELRADTGWLDYLNTAIMSFKFDCTVMAYFIFIPFVTLLILSAFDKFKIIKSVRFIFQYLFVVLSAIICDVTVNYYREYNAQFNNFVFVGLYDDKNAIAKTIMEYYNPYINLAIIIFLIVAGIFAIRFFEKRRGIYNVLSKINARYAKAALIVFSIILFICSLRGSFSKMPAIRKWAYVTKDDSLNKKIINPYRSLKYAYSDFKKLNKAKGKNPYLGEDLSSVFGADSVSQVILKKAKGNMIEKPKQVFLVIMESYDCWPLMDKYLAFGVSKNLNRIAKNGIHFSNVLPSDNSTFDAYGTLVSGMPYCGVNISLLGSLYDPYLSSIFKQFKKLGYKTNVFYGGFVSWQNLGEFSTYQGAEQIFSGVDMGGKSDSGDWGVEDEKLFDKVLESVNPEEYTFNLILTSSYHSPYAVDVWQKGFPYNNPNDIPEEVRHYFDGAMTMQELGHVWYGDYAIGKFMDSAEEKYQDALFAFTGDHYARRFINHFPNLFERSAVPFILYGKGIPAEKNNTPGSHINIPPTLVELIAPKDFEYYSFGNSFLLPDKNTGFGFGKAVDHDSLYHFPEDAMVEQISLSDFGENKVNENKYRDEYNKLMGLSWHYIMRGNSFVKPGNN